MQTKLQLEKVLDIQPVETPRDNVATAPQWGLTKRIGYRFLFVYMVLSCFEYTYYCLMFTIPVFAKYLLFLRGVANWYGKHVIHLGHDIGVFQFGSGDTTNDWVLRACYLTFAAIATVAWSLIDNKRPNYIKLNVWLRTYLRLFLAGILVLYGAVKIFPLQMPYPSYTRLLEPYGESSPMGILWAFIGSSPVYCSITGLVETTAGILLLFPRLVSMGSLLSTIATTHVFILNMCYDVPVKLFSFQLLLISVILLWPDLRRLSNMMIFNRAVEPVKNVSLVTGKWPKRILAGLAVVYGLYLVGWNGYGGYTNYKNLPRITGKRPALYGIWNVDEHIVDGAVRPPLLTDESRWQKVIFQTEGASTIKPMDGPNQVYTLKLDPDKKTLEFGKATDKDWKANLTFEKQDNETLTMTGQWDGHNVQTKLKRFDESKFLLTTRGFHWISETPFNK